MANKSKGQQQPRSVSQDLTAQKPGKVREGLHLARQKTGNTERAKIARQLLLWEGWEDGPELEQELKVIGLNLSVDQHKALHALQILLERTNYEGNLPPIKTTPKGYSEELTLPRLAVTTGEYCEAYGLLQGTKGKARLLALEALRSLTERRRIAYKRQRSIGEGKARRRVWDVVVSYSPLIILHEGYQGLETEEEADEAMAGRSQSKASHLLIEISPIMVDQIGSSYILKPIRLHQEISEYLGHGRYSDAIPSLLDLLMTYSFSPVKIRKELLLERLRLDKMKEQKNTGRMRARLQEAIDAAQGMGYLLAYEEDPTGLMYIFHLNPERCSRVKQGQIAGPDEEQEP